MKMDKKAKYSNLGNRNDELETVGSTDIEASDNNGRSDLAATIQSRLEAMGTSQQKLKDMIGVSQPQLSVFLRGKGSLTVEHMNKCLDAVGIDLSLYVKRNELAKEVAVALKNKMGLSAEIGNLTKEDLAQLTGKKEVLLFFDVKTEEEFKMLFESGIIDIESTYPYFRGLVNYYYNIFATKRKTDKTKISAEMKDELRPTPAEAAKAMKNLLPKTTEALALGAGALNLFSKGFTGPLKGVDLVAGSVVAAGSIVNSILSIASTFFDENKKD